MNFQKLTLKSQVAVQTAGEIAVNYNNQAIEETHLFAAMIQDEGGIIPEILMKIGVNMAYLKVKILEELEKLPKVGGTIQQYVSPSLMKILDEAEKEAKALKDEYISTEHILIALSIVKSRISQLLKDNGVNKENIYKIIHDIRGNQRVTDQNPEDKYQALKRYGRQLNEEAKLGKLDPVIGREDEIRRVLQVLSRRTKNNPILIGEPGVGKTAIVEGIAHRIVSGDVPDTLKFEERLKAVIKEVTDSAGQIILFIDEIHTLIGAGATTGSMDAANILKPALSRGDLRCIGATTIDDYQKYIEKDAALERRFQKIMVEEPTIDDTISILRGLKERYEVHHGARITDPAIVAASELSTRYITDRFLPDKAIDLIDEAASKLRMEIDSMPAELDSIERKIRQLEIEKQALLREIGNK